MCGRYTLTTVDLERLARELDAALDPAFQRPWRPRFNVAPGDLLPVLRREGERRVLREGRFGYATGTGELIINARAETAARKPTFRDGWAAGRCVVPADGFFEWRGAPGARRPLWYHRADGRPLLFAAVSSRAPDGQLQFAIVTVEANADVRDVHDRMPAILADGESESWLRSDEPPRLAPVGTLSARPVSPRVNSVRNDDAACLEPDREEQLPLL
jgi:putative SOS response-associated peptidase YedK